MVANDPSSLSERGSAPTAVLTSGYPSSISNNVSVAPPERAPGQVPIAVVGVSCRLPGHCNSPHALWNFIEKGGIAANKPPASRFNIDGHYDKSLKPNTMRSPGGMFLEDVDPQVFDAPFFNLAKVDAIAMDPQQRQLLETVYECLENAGVTLEQISGKQVGCFVGSYASDYGDMANRDPEDRAESITIGVGRAILSNRISHFLDIKGPSMTIDTACSGSLVSVDVGCQYLQGRQASGVIVAACNMYLSPDHNMDMGAMRGASSATGKCHTFDAKADGYIKGEAVNAVYLKRLDDAIRDGDPIRAVIRGTATNSDGNTPGIASPSSEAQASAIRTAYANAGIKDFNETGFLECHGTGTLAGDPIEVTGAASVFGSTRLPEQPLIIGSIKSNIGHSEPAAGISGLIKAVMAVEKGIIPGNPTFVDPNPKIDFDKLRVRATRHTVKWPDMALRRASVNSFGYGGSNAHVVVEAAEHFLKKMPTNHVSSYVKSMDNLFDFDDSPEVSAKPNVLVFSANDEIALKAYISSLNAHLTNPNVSIKMKDLAYTLSERRTRHFHRAFLVTKTASIAEDTVIYGKKNAEEPKIGFIFTGQGAQWSQMGKDLINTFPAAKQIVKDLDAVLHSLPNPPQWSLMEELTEARRPEQLRQPEFSQPLVTALQLAMLTVLNSWGVNAQQVVGHSSGEIAAACAAGLLTPEEAIKIAFFRGQAAKDMPSATPVGMLAVGVSAEQVQPYLEAVGGLVEIACFNSPSSLTLSGSVEALQKVMESLKADGHFARMLQVDLAYHSKYMHEIGEHYETLLNQNCQAPPTTSTDVSMVSSVTGTRMTQAADSKYWKSNMVSPVRFAQACTEMLSGKGGADFLIEIGPSNALSGPVAQIKKSLPGEGSQISYTSAAKRGSDSLLSMYDTAGKIFIAGGQVQLAEVNKDEEKPALIIDLPNYAWNHTTKYFHESDASKDWRFRQFVHHDLLGSKTLGTNWDSPVWRKVLRLEDVPWLKHHMMGTDIIFPGAGYIAMAMEAIYQVTFAKRAGHDVPPENYRYELKDVKFPRALVLEDNTAQKVMLSLSRVPGSTSSWHEFRVSSMSDEAWIENSHGFVRIQSVFTDSVAPEGGLSPLQYPTPGRLWYKAMSDAGYNFGPDFQKHLAVESTVGKRQSRSMVSLEEPGSKWKQSHYPMHPACMDGCFQSVAPSLWLGDRSSISQVLVPAVVDSLVIGARPQQPPQGVSLADSYYLGVGRKDDMRNYASNGSVYDPVTGALLFELKGLRYHRLETRGDVFTSHPYTRMAWKPDASMITESGLQAAISKSAEPIQEVIDMVAFKKPTLKLIEINLDPKDTSSLWLGKRASENSIRAAFSQYSLTSTDPNTMVAAEEEHAGVNVAVELLDPTKEVFIAPSEDFDFVLVKGADLTGEAGQYLAKNVRTLLADGGCALFMQDKTADASTLAESGLANVRSFSIGTETAYFVDARATEVVEKSHVHVARLAPDNDTVTQVIEALRGSWDVTEHYYPFIELKPGSTVVVLDELSNPVLATADETQWAAIQHLIRLECHLLWVTEGSQMDVTNPTKAIAHGFFRTIRAENPILRLMTLDVESAQGAATASCIDMALNKLIQPASDKDVECEFVERNGTVHIARVTADEGMNVVKFEDSQGPEAVVGDLHANSNTVRLICERLGNIDSLHFNEVAPEPLPLKPNNVEVELYASALNFKDVAVSMGIVPENEHLLGLEGAGIVKRVADDVTNRHVGQRVVVFEKGTFANRIQATTERTFPLPDNMTFEEASTLPAVYLTSMYALFYLANLKKGQRVLVHSASGGVGIASIQICKYMECELFLTVGTDEKRQFLKDNYGIPDNRIFSSRNTSFANQIMEATNGEGIDVILNSLIGDLLDASWRIIADGGTMVEIGKKDIIDRNTLSMEPFGRNASFRALDFSYKEISDALIAEILGKLFGLIEQGHLKPISPIQVFPFDDINSAFRVLRGGKHIGKLVISSGLEPKIEVPIRPAKRAMKLRSDVSYLIVGGLKGLCGSLAVYLAKRGAKNLAVISRSGHDDERSQGVVKNVNALGCHIDLLKGDVADLNDVRRCFSETIVPIGGIVQGAMVLRDRPFESMTLEEFHGALDCKVSGTWNLHNVAEERNLKLDFFTMLSSISGVVGQKGQANYAGGNVFLDALAVYRRRLGLPATSVDLGVIEDVGYIHANDGMQQNLDTSIWTGINEGLLRKILEYSILQQSDKPINVASSTQLITGIPIPQPEDSQLRRDARFGPLFIQDASGSGASSGDKDGSKEIQAFFVLLRSKADAAVVLATAVNVVNQHFVKLLRLSEPMEPGRPLSIYGLDSLSAVEFRNWLRMVLQAELTTLEIVNAPSLVSLCEKVISKISV